MKKLKVNHRVLSILLNLYDMHLYDIHLYDMIYMICICPE